MPKRKSDDYINKQLKKLKKLKKKLKRAVEMSSDSSETEEDQDNFLDYLPEVEAYENIELQTDEPETVELQTDEPDTVEPQAIESQAVEPQAEESQIEKSQTEEHKNESQPQEDKQEENRKEPSLDKEILEILGEDPSSSTQYGRPIHQEIASRLEHIATTGLSKDTRKDLTSKYLLPSNATLIGAPAINPEIKAALPETLVSRDKALETKQKILGSALTCLASATTQLIENKQLCTTQNELLKNLMDASRLLCDIQHSDSMTRRMFSLSVLKKDIKAQIQNSKIDKMLFSENLPEALKTAKALSKSSSEIKYSANNNNIKKTKPSTYKGGNLNVKPPAAPSFPLRKPPGTTPQKSRPYTSLQSQPAKSSKMSSQQQRTNRYRR